MFVVSYAALLRSFYIRMTFNRLAPNQIVKQLEANVIRNRPTAMISFYRIIFDFAAAHK